MCLDKLQCDDLLLTTLNITENKNSLYSLLDEHILNTLSIHSIQVHTYNFLLEEGGDEPGVICILKIMIKNYVVSRTVTSFATEYIYI